MLTRKLFTVLQVNTGTLHLTVFDTCGNGFNCIYSKSLEHCGLNGVTFRNPEEVFSQFQSLCLECESCTDIFIEKIAILLPQSFFRTTVQEKNLLLAGKVVTNSILSKLLNKYFKTDSGYKPVSVSALQYKIDNCITENPIGMRANTLIATLEQLALDERAEELFTNCSKRLGKDCCYFADASLVLSEIKKENKQILVSINEKHTDINLCIENIIQDSRCVEWGYSHLVLVLSDAFNISYIDSEKLLRKVNLTLKPQTDDYYIMADGSNKRYPIPSVNEKIATCLFYFVKDYKKVIKNFCGEDKISISIFGEKICEIRGIGEIFDEYLGIDTNILSYENTDVIINNNFVLGVVLKKLKDNREYGFLNKIKVLLKTLK